MKEAHPLALLTVGQVADIIIKHHDFPRKLKKCLSKNFLNQLIENSNSDRLAEDAGHYQSDLYGEHRILSKRQDLLYDSDSALDLISKQIQFLDFLEKALDTGLI